MSRLIEPCKQRLWKSKWTEWPKSCGEKALSRNGLEAIVHCYCGKETIKCALLVQETTRGVAYWNDVLQERNESPCLLRFAPCLNRQVRGLEAAGTSSRRHRRCDELTRYIALTCSIRGHDQTQPCAKLHIFNDHLNGSSKTDIRHPPNIGLFSRL